jgi:hypothetical protein
MISSDPDARDLAFDALSSLATPTAAALERVDVAVRNERRTMDPLRVGFTPTLRAGTLGLGRFGYAVREVAVEWEALPNVRRASLPEQEANNVFLWTLESQYILRIKRDPVENINEGTQRLFAQLPATDRPSQVFLTWDIALDGSVTAPRFACVESPKWTITLGELLRATSAPVVTLPSSSTRGPIVRSKIKQAEEQTDERGDDS